MAKKELTPGQKAAITRKKNKAAKAEATKSDLEIITDPESSESVPGEVVEETKSSKSKVKYWASPTFIPGIGTVRGIIESKDWFAFCQIATQPETQRRHSVDYDPEEKSKRDAKVAIEKRLGIRG